MSGSGMGCPDWPKCFGSWIPPTHISQLPLNYKDIYAERGYDQLDFNVFNTWTEYINRLFGFLGGIFCLTLLLISFYTKKIYLIILSFILILLMGFQAWLGALVVYSILSPVKITLHMLLALLILCLLFFIYRITSVHRMVQNQLSNKWIYICLGISLLQIILGTQVRESIDNILDWDNHLSLISQLSTVFKVHRTSAWLVLLSNSILLFHYRYFFQLYLELKIIMFVIICLFISGIIMSYYSLMGFSQLVHLICAVTLFTSQFSFLLKQYCFPTTKFPSVL